MYPRSFRRDYGDLMAQAFSDRLNERGPARTWLFIASDLSQSIPQQILETSLMSQKWSAVLAGFGCCLVIAAMFIGTGPPILLMLGFGVLLGVGGFLSMWSAKKSGRSSEFNYRVSPPRAWVWWTILAALLGTTYVVAATGQLISDPKGTNVGALAIAAGFALLIAGGLRLRSQSRVVGNWMIVAASAPALAFFWIIVPAAAAIAIIVGAVSETSGTSPKAPAIA